MGMNIRSVNNILSAVPCKQNTLKIIYLTATEKAPLYRRYRYNHRVHIGKRWNRGSLSALSAGRLLQLYNVLDGNRLKGGGRAPPTLISQGWFLCHDGMYARNRQTPVCVYVLFGYNGEGYLSEKETYIIILWLCIVHCNPLCRSAKFGICTVVGLNGTLVEAKIRYSSDPSMRILASTCVPFIPTTVQMLKFSTNRDED